MDDVERRLAELAEQPQNWDSYGSDPLQPGIAERVRAVLRLLASEPFISMTSDGGIDIEWRCDGGDLSITIDPSEVTAYIEGRDLMESRTDQGPKMVTS